MNKSVTKTEVILDEKSVHEIVVAETAQALAKIPNLMQSLIREVLFHRPQKRYSHDKEKSNFFELVIQKTLKPLIEEEIKKIADSNRDKLSEIIKKAFKTNVIDNKNFEDRLIEKLADFSSNIDFYVSQDE